MQWLLSLLSGIREALGFFSDPIVRDAAGGFCVYGLSPLCAIWYVKQVKRTRRAKGQPMTEWDVRVMGAVCAGLMALFFGNRIAGWSLNDAANHAIAVMFLLPVLLPSIIEALDRVAPQIAQDIGDLPTEFRSVDTTELSPEDTTQIRVDFGEDKS